MEPGEEGFDYQDLYKRLVAQADEYIKARDTGEAELSFDPNLARYQERRASKAFARQACQWFDLASAINSGDYHTYIDRYYWHRFPISNGVTFTYRTVNQEEYEALQYGVIRDQGPYDQATDAGQADAVVGGARQEGTALVVYLSSWDEGDDRVGLWTRLRQSWHQVRDKYLHRRDR
jgi:hypothetical protein